MQKFVSETAHTLWKLFEQTGDTNIYLFYNAVQHSNEQDLINAENYNKNQDNGMEL